jgi:DNA excision repair protein ERCC-2
MSADRKTIPVAIRDLAVPVPRTGSIEGYSGYGRAANEGREIHGRIQKKRAKADPSYEAEVGISAEFLRGPYRFLIEGRMDGIFRRERPHIEEIKTAFSIAELAGRVSGDPFQHPYCLQLLSYGYFLYLRENVLPRLTFHLVSTRNSRTQDIELSLDIPAYEQWLELRLEELVAEAKKEEKRAARRRKISHTFSFPFEDPRQGQLEIVRTVEQAMAGHRPLLIQAPTGLGKTVGVLYPVLKEALGRGQKVVYVTPKNSQHAVAEDAIERFRRAGSAVRSLTIMAKGKICFKNEPLCEPGYCEYSRDYYTKVHGQGLIEKLSRKRNLTARVFRSMGEEHEVCPFELQLDASAEADVVICDYNYVFAPRSAFGRVALSGIDQTGRPNLVIDEAQNLPQRAMDYYSPTASTITLEQIRPGIQALPRRFRSEAEELLDGCIAVITSSIPDGTPRPQRIAPPLETFLEQDGLLRSFLSRYLDSDVEILPRDSVMALANYWSGFCEALELAADPERKEFFVTVHPHPTGGVIRITCCDASLMLTDCYKEYEQVVAFSATLKPFVYYVDLIGLDPHAVMTAEFSSPFPKEHRKILIIPQISTKYSDRERNYAKIADAVTRIAAILRGNYFVFFPSFEFLDRVHGLFQAPAGTEVLKQEREMKAAKVSAVLERLSAGDGPVIVFAVQGGTFSEGVDYPGESVIGAFVVGPPLPNYDLEREEMRKYYEERYQAGFDFAYVIPAMSKAVQAAGRVIRSETDRGLIVMMDARFLQAPYTRAMPSDWFNTSPSELVSDSILQDVAAFWKRSGQPVRLHRDHGDP